MGLILGGVTVYFYMWHRQPTSRLKPARTVQYNNLLTTLTNFDHGRMAGKNLNRLLFLYSNLPESQEKLEEIKPNLMSAIEAYKSFTLSQLNNIIEHTRKLTPIKPAKNRLARETQRLSKALDNFSVADMSVGSAGELKAVVPDAINRIKHSIMEIRGHLKTHFSANLLRVIPDVLSAVAGPLQQQGIGFSEITTRGGVAALVFFDESELASIFEELIGNASDAMAESKVKEMVLDIRFSNGEAVVKLSDTGCGLKTQQEDQVFNRDYSTRGANRGFGLFHAQQQVEQFGGHIKLYNNAIGPGATAELTLKTVKYE